MEKISMIKVGIKKISKYIILAILILIVFYNFLSINNTNGFVQIFNYKIMIVEEYQEQKNIEKNTLIIAKESKEQYKENDLLMININQSIYLHRVVEVKGENKYITKGDGNYRPNEEIGLEQIEGKILKQIPDLGILFKIIGSKIFAIFIILILIICVIYNKHIYTKKMYRRIKQKQEK